MNNGTKGARRAATLLVTAGAVLAASALTTPAQAATSTPSVKAKGAFLLNTASGATLYSKAADTKRQMASTTKMMTATVVLDTKGLNLNRKVTVKKTYRDYVTKEGASTADLRTGDKLTVKQLLYATMLPSGCDAAYALADAFGSGKTVAARKSSFIGKMNAKAGSLGMKNTKYDSFDGISSKGKNYTTPRDMSKLARHALKSSTFKTVVATKSTKQKATASSGKSRTYTWYNTNKLLGSYKGAIGIKTGTGTAAGPCLVFAASRGGKTVAGVILNDANRYQDAAKIMDAAFKSKSAKSMKLRVLPPTAQRD
ncbi:D-alanyl-D-alanine carboxypeptidase family protein [Streptomyces tsukubensis]|uniref:D-alanyl-D-alanine carboxypeptidase n=1 Tax=Streptomyces tsukubensis TaxID=83656 RepID=A0A1V4A249_9ACTN|nr:serine hydrolase [Streptomyces tsukubensis]OON72907.1 D-alanyl-D-alanine carboxypeptidase [Streptomyces tsukubensis]QFR94491.1 serine hydrolase [Streptomyces tsukubensis]